MVALAQCVVDKGNDFRSYWSKVNQTSCWICDQIIDILLLIDESIVTPKAEVSSYIPRDCYLLVKVPQCIQNWNLTKSNPIVCWADRIRIFTVNEFQSKFVHKCGDSLVDEWLIFQDLGHTPKATNGSNILVMPIFILGVEQIGQAMTFNKYIVWPVHVTLLKKHQSH